jgi:hypothetical protein
VTGLLEQQGCRECDDQAGAEQIEGVAEGQDVGLLLHDVADRHQRAMRGVSAIDDAVIDEILRELRDSVAGRLFEQRNLLRQHVGVILLALGQEGL